MKAIDQILSLTKEERKAEVSSFSLDKLKEFAFALRETAKAQSKSLGLLANEGTIAKLPLANLKQAVNSVLNQFPEVSNKLAIDREFADQAERLNAIISDINEGKLPFSRYPELLHENYFEREEDTNVVEARTFLAYAITKLSNIDKFLGDFKNQLGEKVFNSYVNTVNTFSYTGAHGEVERKNVNLKDLYLGNHGASAPEYVKGISEDAKKVLERYLPKELAVGQIDRVDVRNIDTHNISSHKSADESHIRSFKRMLEANPELNVEATYAARRENDPFREVEITSKGALDAFVEGKNKELQEKITKICEMDDKTLFEEYVRHDEIESIKAKKYEELTEEEKSGKGAQIGINKKLEGFRFMANAAKRYLDNMVNDHKCNSGSYSYDTDKPATCGLSMEQLVATMYYSSTDFENLSKEATPQSTMMAMVRQLHDMRRGYDIDHGIDKPEEFAFPAVLGRDNNRCYGGGVNSLASALNGINRLYEVKKIGEIEIKNELKKAYKEIITNNIEALSEISTPAELSIWKKTGKVTGEAREILQTIFDEYYSTQFKADFEGYISDNQFMLLIADGLDDVPIPEGLSVNAIGIEGLSDDEIYSSIVSGTLDILTLKDQGYESTLSHLSKFEGRERLIENLIAKALTNPKEDASGRSALSFMSRSNLPEEYENKEICEVGNASITLEDIKSLNETELEALYQLKRDDILEESIRRDLKGLFSLYVKKVNFTFEELGKRYGYRSFTPLEYAAKVNDTEAIKAMLESAGDRKLELLSQADKDGKTPLYVAAIYGNTEAIKAILEAAGDRKFELLSQANNYGETPLYWAAERGNTEAIKVMLEAAGG